MRRLSPFLLTAFKIPCAMRSQRSMSTGFFSSTEDTDCDRPAGFDLAGGLAASMRCFEVLSFHQWSKFGAELSQLNSLLQAGDNLKGCITKTTLQAAHLKI